MAEVKKPAALRILIWTAVAVSVFAVISIMNDAGLIRVWSSGETYQLRCYVQTDAPPQLAEKILNITCNEMPSACVRGILVQSIKEGYLNMYVEGKLASSVQNVPMNTPENVYTLSTDGCMDAGYYELTFNITRFVKGKWPREIDRGMITVKVG